MFKQSDVHYCNKIDDMKNNSGSYSCDLSFDGKTPQRKILFRNSGIISRLHPKSNNYPGSVSLGKGLEPKTNHYVESLSPTTGCQNNFNKRQQCKYEKQFTSESYPRWFEGAIRYLFSKQLRKCFNLA